MFWDCIESIGKFGKRHPKNIEYSNLSIGSSLHLLRFPLIMSATLAGLVPQEADSKVKISIKKVY